MATDKSRESMELDPVFVHTRREAVIIFLLWFACLLWSVPYCYLNGYVSLEAGESITRLWGVPAWIVWGILVPWLLADAVTLWFCFFYFRNDDLGPDGESQDESPDGEGH